MPALFAALVVGCAGRPGTSAEAPAPAVAHHQHLLSPATAALIQQPSLDGAALLRLLDAAGIRRGVVLSMGYTHADERKKVEDPDRRVREENDWTAAQVGYSGGRLIGFCSVNPLRAAALSEIDRCTRLPGMRGLKLHFGNSGVSLRDEGQVARLAEVFAAANARGAAIVAHVRARTGAPYGAEDAQRFIDALLPAAPDVVVQVAHLAGAGGFPPDAEQAMAVFAQAIARDDPRTRRLYFDATTVALAGSTRLDGEFIAKAIREVGAERVLFGTDLPIGGNPPPREAWEIFRAKVPLDAATLRTIAGNVAPYVPE